MARLWCILLAALALCAVAPRPAAAQDLAKQVDALSSSQRPCSSYNKQNCKPDKKARVPISKEDRDWAKARRKGCDGGSIADCRSLGEAYLLGVGVPSNRLIAKVLFEQACDGADGPACGMLADLKATLFDLKARTAGNVLVDPQSSSPEVDIRTAVAMTYDRGCTLGYLPACESYADALLAGSGVTADVQAGQKLLEDTCVRGLEDACSSLADRLIYGNSLTADTDRAIMLLDAQCRRGYIRGCERAARYLRDRPVQGRLRINFLEMGCERSSADSCYELGLARIILDRAGAMPLFEKACALDSYRCDELNRIRAEPALAAACNSGSVPQCEQVADFYDYGTVALRNRAKAEAAFARACLGGSAKSCARAADSAFAEGSENPGRAIGYLERGCGGEDVNACQMLAAAYETGRSVAPDPVRAGKIHIFLCGRGETRSCDVQAELAETNPDIPPPSVDGRYVAPDAETGPRGREGEISYCETHTEKFRGETLTDTICQSITASIGGYQVMPGAAPWQALVARPAVLNGQAVVGPGRVLCGGSLIARGWILTAAHCLYGDKQDLQRTGYTVRLGVYRSHEDEGISYPILRTIPKPGYRVDDPDKAFDVALIQFDYRRGTQVGPTQSVRTIRLDPLPVEQRKIAARMPVYSYGWGWTAVSNSQAANELRGVKMELLDTAACNRITRFSGDRRNIVLCAGGRNREQACFGDSGGPLVYYGDADKVPSLIGVVSAGRKCGTTGEASRYTRVASVTDWINQTINGPAVQAR